MRCKSNLSCSLSCNLVASSNRRSSSRFSASIFSLRCKSNLSCSLSCNLVASSNRRSSSRLSASIFSLRCKSNLSCSMACDFASLMASSRFFTSISSLRCASNFSFSTLLFSASFAAFFLFCSSRFRPLSRTSVRLSFSCCFKFSSSSLYCLGRSWKIEGLFPFMTSILSCFTLEISTPSLYPGSSKRIAIP